jgi:hypothetical protein
MRRRRIEITVATRQMIIRRQTNHAPVWCLECSSAVPALTPEEAAVLAGVSTRMVYRLVEAGQLHFIEAAEQSPLICLHSLLRLTDKGESNHVTEHITDPRQPN